MTGSFLADAIARCETLWREELDHPFVRGIADGSLSEDRFRYYLQQDYVFLIDFARVLALGVAKADDLDTMRTFAELVHATLVTEMDLHRQVCASYGLDTGALAATEPAPACRAYAAHLLSAAREGELAELCAALLPCAVGYARIGKALKDAGAAPPVDAYRSWIDTYASPLFQGYADWLGQLTDRLAEASGPPVPRRMLALFEASVRHEVAFWEMAWTAQSSQPTPSPTTSPPSSSTSA